MVPPALERIRSDQGPFDSDEDLLLSIFFMPELIDQLRQAGPISLADPLAGNAIVELVRQAATSGTVKSLRLVHPGI
jgi:hypothetical protein